MLDPIATLTLELRALGKLKELELFSKTAMTNKEIAARTVRNEPAARKELKPLEERMARERRATRKKLIERKTPERLTEPDEHKAPEQLTEPEIEHKAPEQLTEPETECKAPEQLTEPKAARKSPEQLAELETERKAPEQPTDPSEAPKDLDAHRKPKYQHESRKARTAREVREELRRYRMHRAREDLAASKRETLESIGGLGIGGWGVGWGSATPSSRVAGGVKVSVRGTPSSEGKGSWGGGGWVEKFSSPAGVIGRATVGGWMMARVVDSRLEFSGGRLVSRARKRSVATCT